MPEPQRFVFGSFQLDLRDERLWCGPAVVRLPPKPFAVLACLVTQAGQLVTKDALLAAVWPDTVVSEDVLTAAMRQLRRVLGDQTRPPQVIETVHGRGYRFIAPVSATRPPEPPARLERPRRALAATASRPRLFVGREAELAHLAQWWTLVQQGQRQMGMIVGEPGIGKTALVDAFVAQVSTSEDVWVGHGQCIDHYGAGEAYLSVLEALGRLCRGPEGAPLVAVLRQHAPSWLVHLPALLAPADRELLEHLASGVTPARMLRELAEALEVLTAERSLVLILEDLHWSDRATLEWLTYVVRRRDPARLLLLGTYRPVDVMVHASALRAMVAELRHHPQYAELVLDSLSEAATAVYLRQRCGAQPIPPGLPQLLHQRTGGNPLFLVAMVDELVRQGLLETAGDAGRSQEALAGLSEVIPTSLRQYIEQHLEQLSEADQALLEAASVAGSTFAVAAVAAGVAQAPEPLEARLTALARQGRFIRASGTETWPDGTVTACYQFLHALYHEVVYARVSAGHRVRLHQQIGARKEVGYGAQARQIAAELAVHFARGRDAWRAVHYLQYAGENALRRSAYQEAITHLTTGLEVLTTLPETHERSQQELAVQMTLGTALRATKGGGAPEVERLYTRAHELCERVGKPRQLFRVLWGLWRVSTLRGEGQTARALGEQLLSLAQRLQDADLLLEGYHSLWATLLFSGELIASRAHLEQGMRLYDPQRHHTYTALYSEHDPGVCCRMLAAQSLWLLGYPDQAVASSQAGLALAQQLAHPLSLSFALFWAAVLCHLRREATLTQAHAEAAMTIATDQEFPQYFAQAMPLRGWALAARGHGEEGRAQLQQGLAAYQATVATAHRPYYLALLAEVSAKVGQTTEGLEVLAEALATLAKSSARWWEAELYRLRGELLLQHAVAQPGEAEACFQQALTVARRQRAKSLELRAAMSLARLWQGQGKRADAYQLLAEVYEWFTEGFDTADLQEARALLTALGDQAGRRPYPHAS
jgi:predicted ATPase/DNA-binding winged helix-turn-helix (wHTH) protein